MGIADLTRARFQPVAVEEIMVELSLLGVEVTAEKVAALCGLAAPTVSLVAMADVTLYRAHVKEIVRRLVYEDVLGFGTSAEAYASLNLSDLRCDVIADIDTLPGAVTVELLRRIQQFVGSAVENISPHVRPDELADAWDEIRKRDDSDARELLVRALCCACSCDRSALSRPQAIGIELMSPERKLPGFAYETIQCTCPN